MDKKKFVILIALFYFLGFGIIVAPLFAPQPISVSQESDLGSLEDKTSNIKSSALSYTNATVISDKWEDGTPWNTLGSHNPDIAEDGDGNIHVVWDDETAGPWGADKEIMYANFTVATGQWSNATVISDKWEDGTPWNDDASEYANIAVDKKSGNIYVVWQEETDGPWGDDSEVMCVNYTAATGKWSNATVISDKWDDGTEWNTGDCYQPDVDVDGSGNVHVIWEDYTPGPWGSDSEVMYVNFTVATGQWSNATVISDKWEDGSPWNTQVSDDSAIAADKNSDTIYVVWADNTLGPWGGGGSDDEIMIVNSTDYGESWSNATVISDKWEDGTPWNDQNSDYPDITVDGAGNIHVVWHDDTDGPWGIDKEVMYANYLGATGQWSNATVISDKWDDGTPWNNLKSEYPAIAIDGWDHIHVVWHDDTIGPWAPAGSDDEIMYTKSTSNGVSWSNATVISDKWDDGTPWNDQDSDYPDITVDGAGNIHVVWYDDTDGPWGTDVEIMYCSLPIPTAAGGYVPPGDDDDDDDDEADLLIPIVITVVVICIIGGVAVVVILIKKRIIDISKLKRK